MNLVIRLFPLWAILVSIVAYTWPHWLAGYRSAIAPLLGVVMFGMGAGLVIDDFRRVLARPGVVSLGVGLQFVLMPLLGWAIAQSLGLGSALAAGLILVGACPGGTASNVICYLARGDVALSITLTTVSTLLSVVATPLLTWFWAGQLIPVDVYGMFMSIVRIVLIPVALGVAMNHWFGRRIATATRYFPLLSVAAIVWIIGIVVALNHAQLREVAGVLVFAVALHNIFGLVSAYGIARFSGCNEQQARTVSIEVGMQNSGLAVALATKYFAPLAALPGALFSIWHNLTGSLLAAWWRRR